MLTLLEAAIVLDGRKSNEESLIQMITAYDRNADVSISVWKRERNGSSMVSNNT